jgi:hypothetical protein
MADKHPFYNRLRLNPTDLNQLWNNLLSCRPLAGRASFSHTTSRMDILLFQRELFIRDHPDALEDAAELARDRIGRLEYRVHDRPGPEYAR